MIAYHVTPTENVETITQYGLVPMIGARSIKLGEPEPAVYLFPNKEACEQAIMGWLGEELEEYGDLSVIEVDVFELDLVESVGWELISFEAIPPERIVRVLTEGEFEAQLAKATPKETH